MDFKELMNSPAYDFLRSNPRLGKRIMLLALSGSYGYGTNHEGSDVDFRGVTLNLPSDLIGLTSFEQFEDRVTDTVIYSFNKLISLLINCNPNTIEILGFDEDQYLICSPLGHELLTNRQLFLSKRAAGSFGHYADAQLRRLQNALARDSLPQKDREKHILNSVLHTMEDYNRTHENAEYGLSKLYIDQAVREELDSEIFLDMNYTHYPLRDYVDQMNALYNVVREYDKIGKRNHKKDDNHLNKHAMHLVRLFMMGIDILKEGEIRTRRGGDDLKLLLQIRHGEFMKDGILIPEFYEIVSDYESRFAQANRASSLPDNPDMAMIEKLVERVNKQVVLEEF